MSIKGITAVIPVYNESKNIVEQTIKELQLSFSQLPKLSYQIIVVNDGSRKKYNYEPITKKYGAKLVIHPVNRGYGAALKTGIHEASHEWVLITDADGTYSNKSAHLLIKEATHQDMVIASRNAKISKIPLIRRPVKAFLNGFASFMAGRKIPDLNSGLRIFKKQIVFDHLNYFPERFSFTSTITMICATKGYKVKNVPLNYFKRSGDSYIHPIKDTIRFIKLIYKLAIYFNPTRFFIPLAILILIGDIAWFFIHSNMISEYNLTEGMVLLAIAAYLTVLFGIQAELIVKSRS